MFQVPLEFEEFPLEINGFSKEILRNSFRKLKDYLYDLIAFLWNYIIPSKNLIRFFRRFPWASRGFPLEILEVPSDF